MVSPPARVQTGVSMGVQVAEDSLRAPIRAQNQPTPNKHPQGQRTATPIKIKT